MQHYVNMACIEIKYKDKIFKITNGKESDVFSTSDYSLLYTFLTSGELPTGFYVEGDDVDRNTLFDYLCNGLINAKDNNALYIDSITNKSQKEFINKLIGNNSISNITDGTLSLDNNVLVISSWGDSKNWYGFTDKRMVMITGDNLFLNRYATNSLSYTYANIKSGDKRVINTINILYKKYNSSSTDDLYEKLTWLSNNKLSELLANTYTPSNSKYIPPKNKSIKSILNNEISEVSGYYFKYINKIYLVESKKDTNLINVKNITDNKDEVITASSVKSLYRPIIINHNNTDYYLLDSKWYNKIGSKYNNVSDEESELLFQEYFGISHTEDERINVYNNNITGDFELDGELVLNKLQDNTRIRTATGIYTKTNGVYLNGDEEFNPIETIYDIFVTNELDSQLVRRIKDLEPQDKVLSVSDMRIILYDYFNIKDFSDIKFSYKEKSPVVSVSTRMVMNNQGQLETKPQIILKNNIVSNLDNCAEILLAINYFNYLNNSFNIPSEVSDVKKFWKTLRNIIILNKENPYKNTEVEGIINELAKSIVVNDNFLDKTLELNKSNMLTGNDFVNNLINKGLYIVSCEI